MSIMVNLLELNKKEFRVYTEGCQTMNEEMKDAMAGFGFLVMVFVIASII